MNVTKKFIKIALGSVPIIGIASLIISPAIAFFSINILLLVLLMIDHRVTKKEMNIEVVRIGSERLSVNEEQPILFEIYNKGNQIVNVELVDELPDYHFKTLQPKMMIEVMPGEKQEIGYKTIPRKRGAFIFGKVHAKVLGRLGMHYSYIQFDLEREYKVYPNLLAVKKTHMTMYKNLIERDGKKATKIISQGTAFESLREYMLGDDYRNINWKASARIDQPIVNQYEPEKNQRIYCFIDSGRPMSYTLRGESKLDKAINSALVVSDMVGRNGDLSGLLSFNTEVTSMVMPGKGNGHRDKMMEALYHMESTNLTSNYEDAFLYFKEKERHKSIIFLFTDFDTFEEADLLGKAASVIERNHILVIILLRNEKIESMRDQKAKVEEDIFNKSAAIELLEERRRAIKRLNHKNVMCIECMPEKVEITVINKYIEIKNKMGI